MFPFLKRSYIKRVVRMNATRKGLLGGSTPWRAVWVLLTLRKGWSKVSKSGDAPVTFTEPLREGEAWTIVHVPEQSKRGRGEGRKMLIGPKRKPPRATAIAPAALASIGTRILEAPSAERVNQILGKDLVTDPPPSRYAKRVAVKESRAAQKASAKAAKKADKASAKTAKQADKAAAKAKKKADKASAKAAQEADKAARAGQTAAVEDEKRAEID